jgi:hypothetical protein
VLIQLGQGLNLSNLFDIAIFAIACIAFRCCCHLSELTIPSPNTFDAIKHVSRSILPIITHDSHDVCRTSLHIPWTKTTGTDGADISITACDHPTCPHIALLLHLDVNANIPSHAPLFSFETANSWAPMTKTWFMDHCNKIWVDTGVTI